MRRIVFAVRRLLGAVKDVVGRVVDEKNAGLARFFCKHADRRAVDGGCERFLLLGLVDGRIGGRVHHDVGFYAANEVRQKLGLRQVALATVDCNDFTERQQVSTKLPSNLTVCARDEQPHAKTSALLSGSPSRSFADRIGFAVLRPVDSDSWIVPNHAAFVLRRVIVGGLVKKFRRFAQHEKAVREAFRDPDMFLFAADNTMLTNLPEVGELRRRSTATSKTWPAITWTSFPCGWWI